MRGVRDMLQKAPSIARMNLYRCDCSPASDFVRPHGQLYLEELRRVLPMDDQISTSSVDEGGSLLELVIRSIAPDDDIAKSAIENALEMSNELIGLPPGNEWVVACNLESPDI